MRAAGVFDEPWLSTLVAQYTGGLCADYRDVHGPVSEGVPVTSRLDIGRVRWGAVECATCERDVCERCIRAKESRCIRCMSIYCKDCLRKCDNKDCTTVFCAATCAVNAGVKCCPEGSVLCVCATCRLGWLQDVERVCTGCATLLCDACVQRVCRCGRSWCHNCFADRRDFVCIHGLSCTGCWDGLYKHECTPRKSKRRRLAGMAP